MITLQSLESRIVWGAVVMFAVATTACGGATQSVTGTAPSSLFAMSGAPDAGATFGLLKEGKGKGPDNGTGETPTTPTAPVDDQEDDDSGQEHGQPALQFEGFTSDITGTCQDLTIVINEHTILTNDATDFQRAECTDLKPATAAEPEEASVFHLHIAANMDTEGHLVATYVRMQGPKINGDQN